jgi:hypothetical protein
MERSTKHEAKLILTWLISVAMIDDDIGLYSLYACGMWCERLYFEM